MIKLSKRLSMNLSLLAHCEALADVGCDHAYSSIYACENGLCDKAFAMDLREGPLNKAKINIAEFGLSDRITTILSDGLAKLEPGACDAVLISGMGGMLVVKIIKDSLETVLKAKQLILQPQSDIGAVRHLLHEIGFTITDDKMCLEDGKFYQTMRAIPGKEEPYKFECFYDFGRSLIERRDECLKCYLDERIVKLEKNMSGMKDDCPSSEGIRKEKASVLEALSIFNS